MQKAVSTNIVPQAIRIQMSIGLLQFCDKSLRPNRATIVKATAGNAIKRTVKKTQSENGLLKTLFICSKILLQPLFSPMQFDLQFVTQPFKPSQHPTQQ